MYLTERILDFKLNEEYTLLLNTVSSAMDIIDAETMKKINSLKNGCECEDVSLLKSLYERGYIFANKKDEENQLDKLSIAHKKALSKGTPKNYTICPTMGCNLRCVYCFEGNDNHCNHTLMSLDQLQAIFSFIETDLEGESINKKQTKSVISLYGGEPLLPSNYEIVERVLEFAKINSLEVRIVTNGTTIDKYKELLKNRENIAVQITLDGAKKIHDLRRLSTKGTGTFDEIVRGIDQLVELGVPTHLRTNIDLENIDSLPELISFIKEKEWISTGLVYPYVAPVLDYCDGTNSSMKESELYSRILLLEPDFGTDVAVIKKVSSPCINYLEMLFDENIEFKSWKMSYCEATSGGNFVFSPDGKISTCLMLAGKDVHQIGTFDSSGVTIDIEKFETWTSRTVDNLEKCKECKYSLICGGGCPMAAINLNGDINCPICSDITETVKVFVEHKKNKILKGM